jgi:hypothetical protein
MDANNAIVERALAAIRALGRSEPNPRAETTCKAGLTAERTSPAESPAARAQSQLVEASDTPMRPPETAQAPSVGLDDSQNGTGLPSRRCRACNGGVYWVSVHGAVICARCHAPANRALVKTWYWLPEGEGNKLQ